MSDTEDLDRKPAAVPTPDPSQDFEPTPAESPAEEINSAAAEQQVEEESPAPEDGQINGDATTTTEQPELAPPTADDEGMNETFVDEDPSNRSQEREDAAMPSPQPTLKDPPPPPPSDAAAPATTSAAPDNDEEDPDKMNTPPPAAVPPAGATAVAGGVDDDETKPGAVPGTGTGVPTKKAPPPPNVEPTEVQKDTSKQEDTAGGGDAEECTAKKEEGKKPKPKKEINPKFKDVQETGSWGGQISTVEKVGVGVIAILIVVGVVIAVVMVLGQDDSPVEETVPPATQAPTPMATSMPPDEKLGIILPDLRNNPVTAFFADSLPSDASSYAGKTDDVAACTETPSECAMSWALYTDEFPATGTSVVDRYALAAFYYALGGPNWTNNTNWLTEESHCHWHGVSCNRLETEVEEIDLNENNLEGEIPAELSLIDTIAVISMKQNQISGGLPGDVISSMPKLFVLYIQNNMLTGPIPDNLINEEESLALLFIHNNNFTGPFPEVYCGDDGFREFSLDCKEKNPCPDDCCLSENCY